MLYSLASKEPPTIPPNFLQESDIRLIRQEYIHVYIESRDNTGIAFFLLSFLKNRYIFPSLILSQIEVKRSGFSTTSLKKKT